MYIVRNTDMGLITADGLLAGRYSKKSGITVAKAGEKRRFLGLLGKREDPCTSRGD